MQMRGMPIGSQTIREENMNDNETTESWPVTLAGCVAEARADRVESMAAEMAEALRKMESYLALTHYERDDSMLRGYLETTRALLARLEGGK